MKTFISPKTKNQKVYVRAIVENSVTICHGLSGVGKSVLALGIALEHLMREDCPQKRIYVTRPMIATSEREFPYIKGTLMEKLEPYYSSILRNLTELLGSNGKRELVKLIEDEKIVLQPIELMRGFTYKDCYVVVTEAQNMSIPQAVMAITRLGENCKMIFEGDTNQKDIKYADGLTYLIDKLGDSPDLCGIVEMDENDIMRHPLLKKILAKLDYKGSAYL